MEATKGRLERATGDMGVMSGLIAHNRDDLEELKRRGDRNYYEFKITKSKTPQRVGPVQVTLNKTDQKKSKYTMTVFVDDRSIEKKDKTAGEPVQFYLQGQFAHGARTKSWSSKSARMRSTDIFRLRRMRGRRSRRYAGGRCQPSHVLRSRAGISARIEALFCVLETWRGTGLLSFPAQS